MLFDLIEAAQSVLDKFQNIGYLAYIAGGTVRELAMRELPVSYTVVTNAPREIIKRLFRKSIDDYNKSECITAIEKKTAFDIYYVTDECPSIDGLLSCFDFTVNSMAYSPRDGLIDPFGGMSDIESRVIRFTSFSYEGIMQKPVRLLRAVRYCAQLGFGLSDETVKEIKRFAILIRKAENNRVREEIDKILMSQNPGVFTELHELGILKYILPELDVCFLVPQKNKYHIYNVGEHIVAAVVKSPNDPTVRWAALLHDIGKPECKSVDSNGIIHFYGHHRESVRLAGDIMRRLKMDTQLAHDILILIENHDVRIEPTPVSVKRMMSRTGAELFEKLIELQEADNAAKNPKYLSDKLSKLNDARKIYQKVIAERHPYKINDLAVNGRDLNKLGFRPGHEIGDTLQMLLEEVFIDPGLNTREYLLSRARQYKRKKN